MSVKSVIHDVYMHYGLNDSHILIGLQIKYAYALYNVINSTVLLVQF
jgi:hypothetical protein